MKKKIITLLMSLMLFFTNRAEAMGPPPMQGHGTETPPMESHITGNLPNGSSSTGNSDMEKNQSNRTDQKYIKVEIWNGIDNIQETVQIKNYSAYKDNDTIKWKQSTEANSGYFRGRPK